MLLQWSEAGQTAFDLYEQMGINVIRKTCRAALCIAITVYLSYWIERIFSTYMKSRSDHIQVWAAWEPSNTDPLSFDAFIHHIAFRSVLGSLVSQYRLGEYTGILADHWITSDDQKTWRFHLRTGMQFESGEPIAANTIIHSWTRLAFLLKKKGSHSDFLQSLEGIEKLQTPTSRIAGLQEDKGDLVIKLTKPFPKLLETIAFGLYSVVSAQDFDRNTGAWLDPHRLTAANAYRIREWSKNKLLLELRDDFPRELLHIRPIKTITITWGQESRLNSDLVIGDSNDNLIATKGFTFHGNTPASIAYVHCYNWKQAGADCSSLEKRRELRRLIYSSLRASGIQPVRSFFPLGMQGISEIVDTENQEASHVPLHLKPFRFYLRRKHGNAYFESIHSQLPLMAKQAGSTAEEVELNLQDLFSELDPNKPTYKADMGVMATGVLIEDPRADIRFMFLSKEGIRLPDLDGSIHKELAKENFSPQRVNELLWDQAVIFPIGHFTFGIWTKGPIDLSQLNMVQPPIEFNWIGWHS